MQHNQNGDRSSAALATETRFANTATIGSDIETFADTKVGTLEINEHRGPSRAERRTAVISVLLVDDHALMREGLRQLLALEHDMKIAGEAVDGYDALRKIRRLRPDVVLMDISMPVVDGLAVTRQITQEIPSPAVIILTMHRQQQQMLQAMKNGARGYLLKSVSSQELAEAIRKVRDGSIYIEPELAGAIVHDYRRLSNAMPGNSSITELTEKELEIIRYVAAGMSNREIADSLAYSEKTVKNYLSIIFQKLGIRDRTQAAIFALRQGLIPEEE
ncbi:MAG TPA: response regulator transcription factor [Ktedonobacteraceae bacterium]|jgi:DNA-binding NarL/FixJ family response regulator|nr:response regulator transcription factor [Ktedonobacteraceae bacterium]